MGATTSTDSALPGILSDVARRVQAGESSQALLPSLLQRVAEGCNAERAFIIELEGPCQRVLLSQTIDGEQVQDATSRLPAGLLQAARNAGGRIFTPASENLPSALRREFGSLNRKGTLLCRLSIPSGKPTFLFLENRFCPVEEPEAENGGPAVLLETLELCLCIAGLQERLKEREAQLANAQALLPEGRVAPRADPAAPPAGKTRSPQGGTPAFKGDYGAIITCSPRMHSIFRVIDKVAHTSAPVLITGESGTGKELIARAIHESSTRAGKPFIPENCAALTETLLESELFGFVKGAFTGANAARKGLLELANGGTLFLDEVGEMSPGMQKKLLRVLQEGVIRPVGGKEFIAVDVRVISATNRDLAQAFQEEAFREDLFYRLNGITIDLPPLRERAEDIPLLLEHFLSALAREGGKPKAVSPEAMAALKAYRWPGNVRQLQNEAQRLHALSGDTIEVQDLSPRICANPDGRPAVSISDLDSLPLKQAVESFEREFLRRAIARFGGNKARVAQGLGIPKTSLYNKLQKHGLA